MNLILSFPSLTCNLCNSSVVTEFELNSFTCCDSEKSTGPDNLPNYARIPLMCKLYSLAIVHASSY